MTLFFKFNLLSLNFNFQYFNRNYFFYVTPIPNGIIFQQQQQQHKIKYLIK